jgi:hypothetical protein
MTAIIEAKLINGKPARRMEGSPEGAWLISETPIDAILDHVTHELGIRRMELYVAINVEPASISRCRAGTSPIQDQWLLRLQLFSGIPVAELLRVACIEHSTFPHRFARRAA